MAPLRTVVVATANEACVADLARAVGDRFELLAVAADPPAACRREAVCFVDWLLPTMSGVEMCRRLRASPATAQALIVMVLDDDSTEARARAMRAGADDYLIGPMTPDGLLERLGGLGAPPPAPFPGQGATGRLSINLVAHRAYWSGKPIGLRPNDLKLLTTLIEHSDRLLTREQMIELLGKDRDEIDSRTVDVWIRRLRSALREQGVPDVVRTVRPLGYVFDTLVPVELIRD